MIRLLLILWLLIGVAFAGTSFYAEILVSHAMRIMRETQIEAKGKPTEVVTPAMKAAFAEAMIASEEARTLAPELRYLRTWPAQLAMVDPTMPDEQAIDALQKELDKDPYNYHILLLLCLRMVHAQDVAGAQAIYARIVKQWGTENYPASTIRKLTTGIAE